MTILKLLNLTNYAYDIIERIWHVVLTYNFKMKHVSHIWNNKYWVYFYMFIWLYIYKKLHHFSRRRKLPTMGMKRLLLRFCSFYLVVSLHLTSAAVIPAKRFVAPFNRTSFPSDFIFGAASAAYQVFTKFFILILFSKASSYKS